MAKIDEALIDKIACLEVDALLTTDIPIFDEVKRFKDATVVRRAD